MTVSAQEQAPAVEVEIRKDSSLKITKNDVGKSAATATRTPPPGTVTTSPGEASLVARYTAASIVVAIFAVWGKFTFVTDGVPGGTIPLHSWKVPIGMNIFYLVSLPLLRTFTNRVLNPNVDVKSLLKEAMLVYNVGQVVLNAWMVYAFVHAVWFGGHPIIGGAKDMVETGVTYAVWVHYCDKYLEYMDTYFMVLRGRMDQVRSLRRVPCCVRMWWRLISGIWATEMGEKRRPRCERYWDCRGSDFLKVDEGDGQWPSARRVAGRPTNVSVIVTRKNSLNVLCVGSPTNGLFAECQGGGRFKRATT